MVDLLTRPPPKEGVSSDDAFRRGERRVRPPFFYRLPYLKWRFAMPLVKEKTLYTYADYLDWDEGERYVPAVCGVGMERSGMT
jgi:hypothetical protein